MTNSEDPEEIQTTFHRGLHCILGQTRSPEKEMKYFMKSLNIKYGPS